MAKKKNFWDTQYKKPTHLALSDEPAEDLLKFTRWIERNYGKKFLNVTAQALDLGCGNGRNLMYLSQQYGMRGVGYDISETAITQAKAAAGDLIYQVTTKKNGHQGLLQCEVRSIAEPLPLPDASATLVLDMMSSHVLLRKEREFLRSEILRTLRPNGWLFFKSFLLEEDQNAARMLREFPGPEQGMYIHPEIGAAEYVWTESALRNFFEPYFVIHKIEKSHKHINKRGEAWKRRTTSVYLEKR